VPVCELLQSFFQSLPPPLAAFGGYFTFDLGKARYGLFVWFHVLTLVGCFAFIPGEEPLPSYNKNSVKMHP